MKKIILLGCLALISQPVFALVTSAIPTAPGSSRTDLRLTREGGKIKPVRDKDSWQTANNQILAVGYTKALKSDLGFGDFHNLSVEYRRFVTPKEKIDGQEVYDEDHGNQLSLGWSFDLFHVPERSLGIFLQASPLTDYNEEKFAVTRVDLFRMGVRGGMALGNSYLFEHFFMVGSGIPGEQNPYAVVSQKIGRRFGDSTILRLGPYLESDFAERVDEKYRDLFPDSSSERVRLFKVGFTVSIETRVSASDSLQLEYLQKVYGQSLTSTNALSLNWAHVY